MTDFDTVVVGSGPAGGAAAVELARAGASVLLVDRARFPRRKLCGACLSAGAVGVLDGLDVRTIDLGAVPLERLTLATRAGTVRLTLDGACALTRGALDLALARSAESAGATFWPGARAALGRASGGARIVTVVRDGRSHEITARIVIDATGLGRGLAEDGHRVTEPAPGARVGLGNEIDDATYPVGAGEVRMVVGRSGYVGLVRVESGALNVAAAVDARILGARAPHDLVADILAEAGLPPLAAEARDGWRGTPPLMQRADEVGAARLLRVGDAAGYVEPFTGEGIAWALGDGRAAAALATRALEGRCVEWLREWRQYRRVRRRRAEWLCRTLAWSLRRPVLVDAAVGWLRVAPALAAPLVRRAARVPASLAPASVRGWRARTEA